MSDPLTLAGSGTVTPSQIIVKLKIKHKGGFLKGGREKLSSKDGQLDWQPTSQRSSRNQKTVEWDLQCVKENTYQSKIPYAVKISQQK